MRVLNPWFSGGGKVTDQSATVSTSTTGAAYTLTTAALSGSPTWTKVSGNANLTVSGGAIVIASGIANGVSQSVIVRGVVGNDAVEFQVTLTGVGAAIAAALKFNLASNSQYIALRA